MKNRLFSSISLLKILIILLYPLLSLSFPSQAQAAYRDCSSSSAGSVRIISGELGSSAVFKEGEISSLNLTLDVSNLETGTYKAWIYDSNDILGDLVDGISDLATVGESNEFTVDTSSSTVDLTLTGDSSAFGIKSYYEYVGRDHKYVHIFRKRAIGAYTTPSYCELGYYTIENEVPTCSNPLKVSQLRVVGTDPSAGPTQCVANSNASCVEANREITIETSGLVGTDGQPYSGVVWVYGIAAAASPIHTSAPGLLKFQTTLPAKNNYSITLNASAFGNAIGKEFAGSCKTSFEVSSRCDADAECSTTIPVAGSIGTEERVFELCSQISNTDLKGKCTTCIKKEGVWTAVGCIDRKPQSIVKRFMEIGLGVGGAICLLMCLSAGFMITTSQGNPTQVNEAREMITSAIIGLLFIIFSVFILQFIGVTIFNIPGFGGPPPTTP